MKDGNGKGEKGGGEEREKREKGDGYFGGEGVGICGGFYIFAKKIQVLICE